MPQGIVPQKTFPDVQIGSYVTLYSENSTNTVMVRIDKICQNGDCEVMRLERATPANLWTTRSVLDPGTAHKQFRFRKAEIATPDQVVEYMKKMQAEITSELVSLATVNARYAAEFAVNASALAA